jgi:radical SAM protein with 4Fe4S-binding SPASM domain
MSQKGRICNISRMTADAKSILKELEVEQLEQRLEQTLERCREDPAAGYDVRWYPRFVVWELTLACNMRCEHCGSSAGKARKDELTRDEMLRVCDELGALGCERVTLLGGEPLIHKHWFDVARRIRDNGFRANVITNGWTLNRPEVCDKIKEAELTIVGISVDGYGESHDRLRLRPGSFERIIAGIDLLQEREIPVAISTVITNDSLDEIEQLYGLLRDKQIKVWQLQIGNPLGRLERDDPLLIKPERLRELFSFIMDKQNNEDGVRVDLADNVGYYGRYELEGVRKGHKGRPNIWTGCHAGIQAMGLDSNGDVKGCQSMPSEPAYIEGNIRQRPLAEIWNDPNAFRYTRGFKMADLRGYCAECRYGPLCKAGCSSGALSHSGHLGDNPICIHRVEQQGD